MRKKKPIDRKGYYRLLKVSSDAAPDEIRLSHAMLRQNASGAYLARIDEAFKTLKDAKSRAAYDGQTPEGASWLKSPYLLPALIGGLAVIALAIWLPIIARQMKEFRPGQRLMERNGREFGTIVKMEKDHRFPQGAVAPAYLVTVTATNDERWFPASDITATFDAR